MPLDAPEQNSVLCSLFRSVLLNETRNGLKTGVTCSESWDGCPDAGAGARPDAAADADTHADVALPRVAVVALGAAAPAAAATHFVDSLQL